jgi:4-amino-4-deoxy-L-arabinose transferase-like glycosyltransferase
MQSPIKKQWALAAMGLFQLLFLAIAGLTGVAPNLNKLLAVFAYTIIIGLLLVFLPAELATRLANLKKYLLETLRGQVLVLLVITLVVGALYVVYLVPPVFDEENIFGASRIVATEGVGNFFAQYLTIPWLGTQHPPLIPLLYGLAMHLFGIDLIVLRLVTLLFTAGSVLLTLLLGRELYGDETGLFAALLLLAFTYVFRVGAAAAIDPPVVFFFTLAIFLVVRLERNPSYVLAGGLGACIGLGLLTKYTMLLIYPVLFGYVLFNRSLALTGRYLLIAAAVLAIFIAVWLAYAYHVGVLEVQSVTISNYVNVVIGSRGGLRLMLEWVVARLPSAIGPYEIPLILLGTWGSLRTRNPADLFILFWCGFVFLFLILTLPDTRYFMLAFPALAIVAARGVGMLGGLKEQATLLALLYGGGALYLFVDWHRTVSIFLR